MVQRPLSNVEHGSVTLEFSFTPKPGFVAPKGTLERSETDAQEALHNVSPTNLPNTTTTTTTTITSSMEQTALKELETEKHTGDLLRQNMKLLEEKLHEAEGKVETSQQLILRLENEIDTLKESMETQRKEIRQQSSLIGDEENRIQLEEQEIEELQRKLQQAQSQIKEMKRENLVLTSEISSRVCSFVIISDTHTHIVHTCVCVHTYIYMNMSSNTRGST